MGNKAIVITAILALGCLVAFGWLLLKQGPEGPELERPVAEDGDGRAEIINDIAGGEIQQPDKVGVERIKPIENPVKKKKTQTTVKPTKPSKITLQGTITVVDQEGREFTRESGCFYFVLWKEPSGIHHKVEVKNGNWTTEIPTDVELKLTDIKLRGRIAVPYEVERFHIPSAGFLALKVKWTPVPILHVIASDTGRELDDVELASVSGMCFDRHPLECRLNTVFQSESSPINMGNAIQVEDNVIYFGKRTYFARSPGYAWKPIEINFHKGREYFLKLKPGGDLEIDITGYKSFLSVVLRLNRTGYKSSSHSFVRLISSC